MKGPPRCPVCKAWLTADRTIGETHLERSKRWEYRLACPGCLSVILLSREELSSRPRSPLAPSVEVAGAVVARQLERLKADRSSGAMLEEVRADPVLHLLLRVPEVFAAVRPFYREAVVLAEPAAFHLLVPPGGEPGRVELKPMSEDGFGPDPEPLAQDLVLFGADRVRVRVGARMRIKGAEPSRFLLAAPPGPVDLAWLEGLMTYPDLVRPADPW